MTIPIDDVLIAVADDDPSVPVHAAWHGIRLEVGPYTLEGELPTLPGFDPGRALTRPSGEFVLLRDVRVGLRSDRARAPLTPVGHHALVNRYAVERVAADLMLGFFFPGAAMVQQDVAETGGALTWRRASRPAARQPPEPAPAPDRADRLAVGVVLAPDAGMPGAHPERSRLDVPIRDEALLDRPRDRLLEHPLDAAQQVDLVDADEADRLARRAGPAGPADAVDVVLRVPRQLEVDDDRQVLDVEAAGGDVGRDEDPDLARLEALERARPLRLRAVGVDRDGVEALAVEPRGQPRRGQLGPREDEHLAQVVRRG